MPIYSGGWIDIQSVWKSKVPHDLFLPQLSGSPRTWIQVRGGVTVRPVSTRPANMRPTIDFAVSQKNSMPRPSPRSSYLTPTRSGSGNRVIGRSPLSTLGRYAASYVTPDNLVKVAKVAGKVAKQAYSAYKAEKSRTTKSRGTQTRKSSKAYMNTSTGVYGGTFRKPKRNVPAKIEALCLRKGYHATQEVYSDLTDSHCVYLTHSTYNAKMYAHAIVGALLRKLFAKAGYQLNSQLQELTLNTKFTTNATESQSWKIEFSNIVPMTGVISVASYITTPDQDLRGVINNFTAMKDYFKDLLLGKISTEPYELKLFSADADLALDHMNLASSIVCRDEHITIYASSRLNVQNRTKGASAPAGDASIERVDNQPLRGYLYQFRNADPRLSGLTPKIVPGSDTNASINQIDQDGMYEIGSSALPWDYQEPPVPKKWSNCSKASAVVMQPGQIKSSFVYMKYAGKLATLLNSLSAGECFTSGGSNWVNKARGRAEMLSLEELIRTSNENSITLQYEREFKVGVILKTKRQITFVSDFHTQVGP